MTRRSFLKSVLTVMSTPLLPKVAPVERLYKIRVRQSWAMDWRLIVNPYLTDNEAWYLKPKELNGQKEA